MEPTILLGGGACSYRLGLQACLTFAPKGSNPLVFRIANVEIGKVNWINRVRKGGRLIF